jgi:DNA gyrase subunit A
MTTNEEDFAEQLINAKTHDYILFFSNRGRVYRIKGYEIPEFSRQSKGLPIINLLPLEKEEKIRSVVVVDPNDNTYNYLVFATKKGLVKRTRVEEFDNIRSSGKIAILLKDEDELVKVDKTTGDNEIIICSSAGRAVRFNENEIRSMGRNTSGVKGIDIIDSEVVGCEVITDNENQQILIITKLGYGKKTNVTEFRLTHRGSKGVKALNVTEKNGQLVSIRTVHGDEDLMVVTDKGVIIRLSLDNISTLKRATQGVRLIRLKDDQSVGSVAIVQKEDEEELSEEEDNESSDVDMSNNDQQVYNVQPEESNVAEE